MKRTSGWLFGGLALLGAVSGYADQTIAPANGKGWGEANSAESLLNMNRDPDTIKRNDPRNPPIGVRGTCTDDQGRTFEGDDDEYNECMNHQAKKRQKAK